MQRDKAEHLEKLLHDISVSEAASLQSWNEFAREIKVPSDLLPGLMTGRHELLLMARPRDMTADEVKLLLALITTMAKTNFLLRQHAEAVSLLMENWTQGFRHLESIGWNIEAFANFDSLIKEKEEVE